MARGTAKQLEEQMVSAAWMYYDEGLTHEEIAARLRLSRVKVTRLLQRALREGIVQIRIARPLETLPVPVVMQSYAAREAILEEEAIRTTLDHARNCDIALVGLGDVAPSSTMARTGYLTEEDLAELRARGAVGDILMRHYDADGHYVASPLDGRIVSLSFPDICRIPHIVAMAVGANKVEPILGAVRGRLCHSLITDTETAVQVLERVGEQV